MAYQLAVYFHLCALFAAFSASTLLHFIESRECAASTVGEVRGWHGLMSKLVRVFPVSLLVLVASGGYLVHSAWDWHMGWVQAGLVGVGLLLLNGPIIAGSRHRRIQRFLDAAGDGPVPPVLAAMLRDRLMRCATWANTVLALGIALAMTLKTGLAASIAILVVAMLIGAAIALPARPARTAPAVSG
jgi:hypothetical protein